MAKSRNSATRFRIIRKAVCFLVRIAAVAILPLIAITVFFLARPGNATLQDITLSTDYGCTSKATLPDGTLVWLNANSSLSYPQNMHADSRDVNLKARPLLRRTLRCRTSVYCAYTIYIRNSHRHRIQCQRIRQRRFRNARRG